jgi:hypothetical protein
MKNRGSIPKLRNPPKAAFPGIRKNIFNSKRVTTPTEHCTNKIKIKYNQYYRGDIEIVTIHTIVAFYFYLGLDMEYYAVGLKVVN